MNHHALYYKIIDRARLRQPLEGYAEKHHILPRSLGGDNSSLNLVQLTPKEHFICHYLLCHMYPKESPEWHAMIKAFMMMCRQKGPLQERYVNSRLYSEMKVHHSAVMKAAQAGQKNSQFGTLWIHRGKDVRKIKSSELGSFIEQGYARGRRPSKPKKSINRRVIKRIASVGEKNSQHGSIWINNGILNRKFRPSINGEIPEGWSKGRIMNMMN